MTGHMTTKEARLHAVYLWGSPVVGRYAQVSRGRTSPIYRVGFWITAQPGAPGPSRVVVRMGASDASWEAAFAVAAEVDLAAILADIATDSRGAACAHTVAKSRGYHGKISVQCQRLATHELVGPNGTAISTIAATTETTLGYCDEHAAEHQARYSPPVIIAPIRRPAVRARF